MTEKLGPCPLCGGLSRNNSTEAWCRDANCISRLGNVFTLETWSRLSAMAASNRRTRAVLEQVRTILKSAVVWNGHEPKAVKVIDEALKGGEG